MSKRRAFLEAQCLYDLRFRQKFLPRKNPFFRGDSCHQRKSFSSFRSLSIRKLINLIFPICLMPRKTLEKNPNLYVLLLTSDCAFYDANSHIADTYVHADRCVGATVRRERESLRPGVVSQVDRTAVGGYTRNVIVVVVVFVFV